MIKKDEKDHEHEDSQHTELLPHVVDERNINVESARVHIIGDMINSVGVIIAAIFVYINPDYVMADPICTYVFSVLVMFTTFPIM